MAVAEIAKSLGKFSAEMAAIFAAEAVLMATKMVSSTNVHISDVTGDKNLSPTKEETNLQENKTEGVMTESSISDDSVTAQSGNVDANESNVKASKLDTNAVDTGAEAMKTKAGATHIETKAMKMN